MQDSSLAATGFVKALPADVRTALLASGRDQRFARGQIIQQRGDRAREFWYVASGTVQIGRYGLDGRLILFALLGAGDTFGELAFMGEFPRAVDAIAGSACTLTRIGEGALRRLMESDPAITWLLLKTMALTVQEAFDLIEASRNRSVPQRLAQALLQLSADRLEDRAVRATQQDLADLIGVSRVSLGKALARLQEEGLVDPGYGFIGIADRGALRAFLAG